MDINKDKLKAKYVLNCFKAVDGYPTTEDLMYQIVNYCYLNNKDIISDTDLVKLFEMDDVFNILNILQKENYLLFDKDLKNKKTYKIIKNPFA